MLSTLLLNSVSHIDAYQESRLDTGQSLEESLNDFVDGPQRLYVLIGEAGVGKTTSVLRWMHTGITNTIQSIQAVIKDEEYQIPPQEWIYVNYSLRKCTGIRTEANLTKRILDSVNAIGQFWNAKPRQADTLLEEQQTHWLFFLDGLDELPNKTAQDQFLDSLRQFLDRYPGAKVVVTLRPICAERDWSNLPGRIWRTLAPFAPNQIRSYLTVSLPDGIAVGLLDKIEEDQNLAKLSAYPTFLEALVDYFGPQAPNTLEKLQDPIAYLSSTIEEMVPHTSAQPVEDLAFTAAAAQDLLLESPIEVREQIAPDAGEMPIEVPRLGILLHRTYNRLWRREQQRQEFEKLRVDNWWSLTGDLALETSKSDGKVLMEDAKKVVQTWNALRWLLNLGIMRETENTRDHIEFVTVLTQVYFSASRLGSLKGSRARQTLQQRLEQVAPQYRELLQQIYLDLTGEVLHFESL